MIRATARGSTRVSLTPLLRRGIVGHAAHVEDKPACTAAKGVAFPTDQNGERSTSVAGKSIIAAAIRGSKAPGAEELATACMNEKNWRSNYVKHFTNMVKVSAHSPEAAIGVANAGIDYMHKNFQFVHPQTGVIEKFSDHMGRTYLPFQTSTVTGENTKEFKPMFTVPYKNTNLSGNNLKGQLNKWAQAGTIEPDAAESVIKAVAEKPVDLTGQHFVLIGAGSAMGPFTKLLEQGATVVCVDLPSEKTWSRLITYAKTSRGSIIFPTSKPQSEINSESELIASAGCNLDHHPGEILAWLNTVAPGKRLVIGNYTYLDSDLHVKLSLAADAVIAGLCQTRPDTGLAFLGTPTDLHFIPAAAQAAAAKNLASSAGKPIETLINKAASGKMLNGNAQPPFTAADGSKIHWVAGLSVAQGPNYALAKRLQHWRAIVEFNNGRTVSANIAPSTATASVTHNKTFAMAYKGMPYFTPFEIFEQDTTAALMAGMLISDITDQSSAANPANRVAKGISNPLELFRYGSLHGGAWRSGYTVGTIGETSVAIHLMGGPKAFLPIVYGSTVVVAGAAVLAVGVL